MAQNDFNLYSKVVNTQYQDKNRVEVILQKLSKLAEQKSSQKAIEYVSKLFNGKQDQNVFSIEGINIEINNNDKRFTVKIDYDNKVQCFIFKKSIKKEKEADIEPLNHITNDITLKNYQSGILVKNNINIKYRH